MGRSTELKRNPENGGAMSEQPIEEKKAAAPFGRRGPVASATLLPTSSTMPQRKQMRAARHRQPEPKALPWTYIFVGVAIAASGIAWFAMT